LPILRVICDKLKFKKMKIAFLITKNHRLLSLVAAVDLFEMANRMIDETGGEKKIKISFIGLSGENPFGDYFQHISCYDLDSLTEKQDLIVVPAFSNYDMPSNIQANYPLIPFLTSQYHQGTALMSLCTGTFLLAATGLLNGKSATTHVDAVEGFQQAFPEVRLQPQAVITSDSNIYTSGGATSSFHLKLYYLQKHFGRELALKIAKAFAIDLDRNNQLYFDQFRPNLVESDELVRRIQLMINEKYHEIKNLEEALEEIPSSKRNIIRRFKQSTGLTPIRYLQKTKIEAAKNLLETTNKDIVEVMVSTGYNDMKNFRQLFKNFTGMTPTGYREKYGMRL
jgi:transcriptional regulator GlxA family with amidase domain